MYVIVYYANDLFQNIGPVMDSSVESIIVGVVRLVVSAIGAACIQRYGRRTLAMFASVGKPDLKLGFPIRIRCATHNVK